MREPKHIKFNWTEDAEARLIALFDGQGYSQSECARILEKEFAGQLTAASVSGKIHRLRKYGRMKPATPQAPNPTVKPKVKAPRPAKPRALRQPGSIRPERPQPIVSDAPTSPLLFGDAGRTVFTVQPNECRYVFGDPRGEYAYCARPIAAGSFCAHHRRLCYVPIQKKAA